MFALCAACRVVCGSEKSCCLLAMHSLYFELKCFGTSYLFCKRQPRQQSAPRSECRSRRRLQSHRLPETFAFFPLFFNIFAIQFSEINSLEVPLVPHWEFKSVKTCKQKQVLYYQKAISIIKKQIRHTCSHSDSVTLSLGVGGHTHAGETRQTRHSAAAADESCMS